MIQSALRFVSLEVRGMHAAVYVLAVSSLLSSVLALLRDRIFAHVFGASSTLDIYYAAFRIPDLIFVTTGALVSIYVLIPALTRRVPHEQKEYVDTIVAGFSLLAVIVSGGAALFAPAILAMLFPDLMRGGGEAHLILLTRIMLLQPFLLGLSNILAAVTQTRHRYMLYSLSPLLYNGGIILGVLVLYPLLGLAGLGWGVVLGAFLHAFVQLPSAMRDGFLVRVPWIRDWGSLFSTMSISVPRSLALSMQQFAFIALTALAAGLAPGSIAVFMFAHNLNSVPLSLVGASYSVAAFPTLAEALARGARDEFLDSVATAARYVIFWSVPIIALVVVLRAHLVRVILGSGAFDWADTRLTAAVLAVFALSLAAQGLMLLLVRAYYAQGKTLVPFLVSSGVAIATFVLSIVLLRLFEDPSALSIAQNLMRLEDVPGSEILALALGYSLASIAGLLALLMHFESLFSGFIGRVKAIFGESVLSALCGGATAYLTLSLIGPLTLSSTLASVFTRGFVAGAFGIIVCALVYRILGSREYLETVDSVRTRLWKTAKERDVTIATSAEETT
jgi:putative peptidoglycan lipid II flippase